MLGIIILLKDNVIFWNSRFLHALCYDSIFNAILFPWTTISFHWWHTCFTNYLMLSYNYRFLIITITPPSDVITWWFILAYFTPVLYCSPAFSFAYFILHYEPVLNNRSMIYKGALDRYPSLQASSPLTPWILIPLVPLPFCHVP